MEVDFPKQQVEKLGFENMVEEYQFENREVLVDTRKKQFDIEYKQLVEEERMCTKTQLESDVSPG